jgi:hypothetical protein
MDYFVSSIVSSSTSAPEGGCMYCGSWPAHGPGACPMVRAVEYYPDGTIKRIERFSPRDLHETFTVPMDPYLPPYPYLPTYPYGYPIVITHAPNMC